MRSESSQSIINNLQIFLAQVSIKLYLVDFSLLSLHKHRYRWIKNGNEFNITASSDRIAWKNSSESGSLIFLQPSADDEGEYYCLAENVDGITRTNKIILRRTFLDNFVNVSNVQKITAHEGDSLKLECNPPKGEPKPSIIWMLQTSYGSIKSVENPRVTFDSSGNLWFSSLTRHDASKDSFYVCSAASIRADEYKLGTRFSLKILPRTKTLKFFSPQPQFISPPNITVLNGQNAEMYCIYDGRPTPTIKWKNIRTGQLIENSERIFPENFGKSLKIKKVSEAEHGLSVECTAENDRGQPLSNRFTINVESPPKFIVEPEAKNVTVNELVEMTCEADGVPKPQIQWFFNGKETGQTDTGIGKLKLKSASKANSGNYACYATNKHGFVFKDIYINTVQPTR